MQATETERVGQPPGRIGGQHEDRPAPERLPKPERRRERRLANTTGADAKREPATVWKLDHQSSVSSILRLSVSMTAELPSSCASKVIVGRSMS